MPHLLGPKHRGSIASCSWQSHGSSRSCRWKSARYESGTARGRDLCTCSAMRAASPLESQPCSSRTFIPSYCFSPVHAYACRDGEKLSCDMAPPQSLMDSWALRRDNQIMGLEIVSIALGTFGLMQTTSFHIYTHRQESAPLPRSSATEMSSFTLTILGLSTQSGRVAHSFPLYFTYIL